ncbi:MAG: HemK/PrmC family methyltransferase, partial [Acidimicrobiales bacterium]
MVAALQEAGCVAADEEAVELVEAAFRQGTDVAALVERRRTGEPLAWITGRTRFCGLVIQVDPGVYVPRWQSEPMARRAVRSLPDHGVAVDLCTGSGALAAVLQAERPGASVLATDIDPVAVACARANGVAAFAGDLDAPLPGDLHGRVNLITAVVPYVPTEVLHLLPRDTLTFEPRAALDGGPGGMHLLARVVDRAAALLRPGGVLILEIGGRQSVPVTGLLRRRGLVDVDVLSDEDGDERAIA